MTILKRSYIFHYLFFWVLGFTVFQLSLFSYHVCVVASVDLLLLFLRPVSLMVDESFLGVG